MVPVFTSLRVAAVLLTAGFCVTTATAQQATRRAAQSSTKPAGDAPKLIKPSPSSVGSTSSPTRPAGGSVSARPAVASAQSPASSPAGTTRPVRPNAPVSAPVPGSRSKYLNVGVGVAAYYGAGLPLGASLEVDLKNQVSVGGSFDYLRYSGGYTFIYAGARGSYHLGELLSVQNKKFDPYAGATLGFRHFGYPNAYDYSGYYNSGLFLGAHLGARYYFSDNVGGFAEVGYGISALKLGLAARF